jgi:hypothetical protein
MQCRNPILRLVVSLHQGVTAYSDGCSHDELIPASALLQGLRLPPTTRVLELQSRLRCRECDARGSVSLVMV